MDPTRLPSTENALCECVSLFFYNATGRNYYQGNDGSSGVQTWWEWDKGGEIGGIDMRRPPATPIFKGEHPIKKIVLKRYQDDTPGATKVL